jgi:hypothetical protein
MAIVLNGDTGISSIGTLTGVTSISSASANTPVIMQDSGSNSNTCRAWVNFNGSGTVAILASFNVSSITDNGTGDYTVNFTTAMPDANYAAGGLGRGSSGSSNGGNLATRDAGTKTTTQFRFINVAFGNTSTGLTDGADISIQFFR